MGCKFFGRKGGSVFSVGEKYGERYEIRVNMLYLEDFGNILD